MKHAGGAYSPSQGQDLDWANCIQLRLRTECRCTVQCGTVYISVSTVTYQPCREKRKHMCVTCAHDTLQIMVISSCSICDQHMFVHGLTSVTWTHGSMQGSPAHGPMGPWAATLCSFELKAGRVGCSDKVIAMRNCCIKQSAAVW